jgi:hypothetical protein
MSKQYEREFEKDFSGRKSGEPHSDWEVNYNYFRSKQNHPKVVKNLSFNKCRLHGTNEKKIRDAHGNESPIFDIPTHAEYSWKKHGNTYAFPLNFHQNMYEFEKQFNYFHNLV